MTYVEIRSGQFDRMVEQFNLVGIIKDSVNADTGWLPIKELLEQSIDELVRKFPRSTIKMLIECQERILFEGVYDHPELEKHIVKNKPLDIDQLNDELYQKIISAFVSLIVDEYFRTQISHKCFEPKYKILCEEKKQ